MTTKVTDASQAPLEFSDQLVLSEWIDFNGHMNVAYYVMAFDHGVDGLTNYIDIGPEGIDARGTSTFTLEMHINYLQELHLDDPISLTCQLLDTTVNVCTTSSICTMQQKIIWPQPANSCCCM